MSKKTSNRASVALFVFGVLFFFYHYGIRSVVPNVFNEDLQRYFLIDATKTGQLIGTFYFTYMIAQIPAGIAIDKFSIKKILIFSFLCVACGMIAFVADNNYFLASTGQMLSGIGGAFSFVLLIK
ncbi:MAG: MFS transporter, partial [Holosporaceae bacterium]|nr:MFS transporter [Holosporaceae bacterium]